MSTEGGPPPRSFSKEDYEWSLETIMPQLRQLTLKEEAAVTKDELDGLIEGLQRVKLYKALILSLTLRHMRAVLFGTSEENPRNETFEEVMNIVKLLIAIPEEHAEKIAHGELDDSE